MPNPHPVRTVEISPGVELTLVKIPRGTFAMGCDPSSLGGGEAPQHEVTISRPFWLGKTPVTVLQWHVLMGAPGRWKRSVTRAWDAVTRRVAGRPWLDIERRGQHPVEGIQWGEAQQFCCRLSEVVGAKCRLPSEAEWEYACRAGTTSAYSFGDDPMALYQHGWFLGNSGDSLLSMSEADSLLARDRDLETVIRRNHASSKPVASKQPNPWGLFDMHGNVWEWCQDWYSLMYYHHSPPVDPPGPRKGDMRIARGGSYLAAASVCRSVTRNAISPDYPEYNVGMRVVVTE